MFEIGNERLHIALLKDLMGSQQKIALSEKAKTAIQACRTFLDNKIERAEDPIYGINTGFGSLCDVEISKDELSQLQANLVMSHACGMGAEVPQEIVKLMLLLKIQGLAQGHSGVQLQTVERLVQFYNEGVYPVVYEQGSLGASGDLAPLAHLCLPLLGMGEVNHNGKRYTGAAINHQFNWEAISLHSKEGLALLNGTQFMSAYASHLLIRIQNISDWADFIGASSLDAFDGRIEPFDASVHQVRPHAGQIATAQNILRHLEGSEIAAGKKVQVQDPYCLRCMPQVHGASKDALNYAIGVLETEINAVTDNPTIFEEEDKVISAGNFHGQPLALILDFLAIATAEWASISERRAYKLIGGTRSLPGFLVKNPGLNSGFMIAQYAAASAVSQNKQLASPASVDTIDSSNGQEDHVSMGANAATKLYRVVENAEKVLGVEWLIACQALDFRTAKSSPAIEKMKDKFRKSVPFMEEDVVLYPLMDNARKFILENSPNN